MMWEIWNEPEGRKNMWIGTDEEYYELYVVTANYLKSQFPDIIVGGPAATKCNDFLRFCLYHKGRSGPRSTFSYTAIP